jgi:hypothetical protein
MSTNHISTSSSSFKKYPKRKYQYILELEKAIEHTKQAINRKRKIGQSTEALEEQLKILSQTLEKEN